MKIRYDRTSQSLLLEYQKGEEAEMLEFLNTYLRDRVPDAEQTIVDDIEAQIIKGNRYDA